MRKKKLLRRKFLNKELREGEDSYIAFSVTQDKLFGTDSIEGVEASIKLADCHQSINIDFGLYHYDSRKNPRQATLRKLKRRRAKLAVFKEMIDAFVAATEVEFNRLEEELNADEGTT